MFNHDRLVATRVARKLTRSDLHRALVRRGFDRCRAMINRWEDGTSLPTANEVALLAATLGVPVESLFDSAPAPELSP